MTWYQWVAVVYPWVAFALYVLIGGTKFEIPRGDDLLIIVIIAAFPVGIPAVLIAGAFTKHGWRAARRSRKAYQQVKSVGGGE